MANLWESGTFTTSLDLLNKMDLFLVNVAGYTRNMAPTVDNTFGTGSRAHYQRTITDGRSIYVNLKQLSAMLSSNTYIPDGISANLSDGYSAAVQWHLQPGGPVMKGSGLSGKASFVSTRADMTTTTKPYDFYTDGNGTVVFSFACTADGTTSNWSTALYHYRQLLTFGFLEDTGCGTGFSSTGGTAGSFIYGKPSAGYTYIANGLHGGQDCYLGSVAGYIGSYLFRSGFHARIKSGSFDGWSMGWSGSSSDTDSVDAGRKNILGKAYSDYSGWVLDYLAQPDIMVQLNIASNSNFPGIIGYNINAGDTGFFPTQLNSLNMNFNTATGKFFCYQPTWYCRDETTLRWFPIGRFPLVYQCPTDTTNFLANPGSITVAGQAYDVRGPLWIKKLTT